MADSITMTDKGLNVPDNPIIPFIEGDGTGPDIWAAAVRVFEAAVDKAYAGSRRLQWKEVLAGEKAFNQSGNWLPDETVQAFKQYMIGIKGPLTTPVGGGIRSLNVALRQLLDLYIYLRPVRYFTGVPSPVKKPQDVNIVIFRENTEDIYAGVEWEAQSDEAKKVIAFLQDQMGVTNIRFPDTIRGRVRDRRGVERLLISLRSLAGPTVRRATGADQQRGGEAQAGGTASHRLDFMLAGTLSSGMKSGLSVGQCSISSGL